MDICKLYIVFHKTLFAKNTEEFTIEECKRWLRWYAVNEGIEKKIPDWMPEDCLIEEYKLRVYDPLYQISKSYQNSTFFHLFWNQELLKEKYIGFAQYDMRIQPDGFRNAVRLMEKQNDLCFVMYCYPFQAMFTNFSPDDFEKFIVKPYNTFYGTKHTLMDLHDKPLPLLHTFILPKWFFLHMMRFVEENHVNVWRMLKFDPRHYAGTMERVFAICIVFGMLEGKFSDILQLNGFTNNEAQRDEDAFRNIAGGSETNKD